MNQLFIPCKILNVAYEFAYKFLSIQVRWSGIFISFKMLPQFVFIHTIKGFSVVYQSLVIVEGLAYLNEAMSHAMQRPTKMHGS